MCFPQQHLHRRYRFRSECFLQARLCRDPWRCSVRGDIALLHARDRDATDALSSHSLMKLLFNFNEILGHYLALGELINSLKLLYCKHGRPGRVAYLVFFHFVTTMERASRCPPEPHPTTLCLYERPP